jgi:TRAP-type C4-dicarboxylate transport system permease small subunit
VSDPPGGPVAGGALAWLTRLASLCLACAVVLMAAQVVLRFGFNAPQAWAEEVDRYLFVWSVYLGTIVAWMRGTHIRVTFVADLLGARAETFSRALTQGLGLFCFAFAAYYGYQLAWKNRFSAFYTISSMPQVLFYLSVPVCLTFLALYIALNIARVLAAMRR